MGRVWVSAVALAAALVGMSGATGALPVASAHDGLLGGNPPPDGAVEQAPEVIELQMSGQPGDAFNTVAVTRQGEDEPLFSGEPRVEGTTVLMDVPAQVDLTAGKYQVGYQIQSADGHVVRGDYGFTIESAGADTSAGAPPATAVPTTSAESTSDATAQATDQASETTRDTKNAEGTTDSSSTAPWVVSGIVLVLIVLAVIIALVKRRTSSE